MFLDALHFVFFFSFDEVRWRLREVRAMFGSFIVWGEKGGVEDVMDFPVGWESEAIGYWS